MLGKVGEFLKDKFPRKNTAVRIQQLDTGTLYVSRPASPQCRGGFTYPDQMEVIGFLNVGQAPANLDMGMISAPNIAYFQSEDQSTREALQLRVDVNCDWRGCGANGERCFLRQKFQQELAPQLTARQAKLRQQ